MTATCPVHGGTMVYGGIGWVRCSVDVLCREARRVECGAFLKRIRPYGYTVVCHEPVAVETFAIGPDGIAHYHTGRCRKHPDTARYAARDGWRIEYRAVTPDQGGAR